MSAENLRLARCEPLRCLQRVDGVMVLPLGEQGIAKPEVEHPVVRIELYGRAILLFCFGQQALAPICGRADHVQGLGVAEVRFGDF